MDNYDPRNDSSPDTEQYRPVEGAPIGSEDAAGFEGVILDYSRKGPNSSLFTCQCGCRLEVMKGRAFRQGHDARLKGILIRAYLHNQEVTILDGGGAISGSAESFIKERGWERFLADSVAKFERKRAAKLRREAGIRQGTKVRFTHRGHLYTGKITDLDTLSGTVEYTLVSGKTRQATVPLQEMEVAS